MYAYVKWWNDDEEIKKKKKEKKIKGVLRNKTCQIDII